MKCPVCGYPESKVIETRPADEGERIRRRRECMKCQMRFTTYEVIERNTIMVIKKDKTHQPFNSEKLITGLLRACEKRPVSYEDLENLVKRIQNKLENSLVKEISTSELGEMVMEELKDLDLVAYVRFASVYGEFSSIDEFTKVLKNLKK